MYVKNQVDAANVIEELAIAAKEVTRLLRAGQSPAKALALAYELRKSFNEAVELLRCADVRSADRTFARDVISSMVYESIITHGVSRDRSDGSSDGGDDNLSTR